MEWYWWLWLGPSILVLGVIVLLLIGAYVWHLTKVKREGRLWKDEVAPFLIVIGFFLLSPLIVAIAFGFFIHEFIMFGEFGEYD